jgi:hypothetical protein
VTSPRYGLTCTLSRLAAFDVSGQILHYIGASILLFQRGHNESSSLSWVIEGVHVIEELILCCKDGLSVAHSKLSLARQRLPSGDGVVGKRHHGADEDGTREIECQLGISTRKKMSMKDFLLLLDLQIASARYELLFMIRLSRLNHRLSPFRA